MKYITMKKEEIEKGTIRDVINAVIWNKVAEVMWKLREALMVNMFENRELEILFDEFLDGLISTVSDYSYEPTETISVGLMRDEDKRKYIYIRITKY